jgi:hypothetical protein
LIAAPTNPPSSCVSDASLIKVDLEQPENNREFLVLSVDNVLKRDLVHTLVFIAMPVFVGDLSRNIIKAEIVADGFGLLITWPSVPHWWLNAFPGILQVLKKEEDGGSDKLIKQQHAIHKANIKSEEGELIIF